MEEPKVVCQICLKREQYNKKYLHSEKGKQMRKINNNKYYEKNKEKILKNKKIIKK